MKSNPFSLFAVLFATFSVISTASAADLTWIDANANNTWNLTELNWNPGPVAWTDSNNAIFAGTAEVVALGTAISAGTVTVNTTGYTLALANNTLTATSMNNGAGATGALTLTGGAGTTSAMNVVTLNAAGSGWVTGTSLNLTGAGNPAAGSATENGRLLKLVFGNVSALGSAELKVQHGMIQAGAAGMTVTNPISIQTGSLYFGGENNFTVSGLVKQNLNNSRTVGVWEGSTGSRTITLGNMDTNGGNFNFEARGAVPATPNTGGGFIVNGAITGIGGINTVGATQFVGNTVTLNGTNTYTGATAHFSGTIAVSSTGSITATSGVAVNTTAVMTNAGSITSTGALTLGGNGPTGGTLSTSGTASFGSASLNGNLNLSGGSMTVSGQFNVGDGAGNYGVINQSAGTMALNIATADGIRAGHWTTTANTSAYNLSGGTLNVLNATYNNGWDGNALLAISGGTANLKGLANGATSHGGNANTVTLTGGRLNIGTSGISQNGGGAKVFTLGVATVGAFADWTGSARMELTDATTGTKFDTLDSVDATTARAITVSGVISGAGKLVKTGAGMLTLSGANTYTGQTQVDIGTLKVSGKLSGTSGLTVNTGATAELGGENIFTTGHGTAMDNARVITVNNGTLLMTASMVSRIGNVTLNNGSTWTSNQGLTNFDILLADVETAPLTFQAATVSITGSGASTMDGSGGIHLLGVQNFAVADVTGSAAVDLTVSMILGNQGTGGGTGGINKTGAGTMLLTGANTYNGNTIVSGGVLAVNGTSIADSGKLVINGGKVDPSGSTETVDTLVLGGVGKIAGTYGSLASAATYKSDVYFVIGSTGVINVTSGPAGNDYANWISGFNVGGLTGPNDDFDNDGLDNSVENVLGSNPSVSNTGLTAVSATGSSFKFQHNQSNEIATDVTKSYQFSTDLIEWKASGGTTNGTTATITEAILTDTVAPANDVIEVTVTVTSGPAVKVFARLVATQG